MPKENLTPHLYLDYDGVLHPDPVFHNPGKGPVLAEQYASHHRLFENAELLTLMLEPYPEVQVVLSTSWVLAYGLAAARAPLPESLRNRVIGATFDPDRDDHAFGSVARGYQIAADVKRRGLRCWVALDDNTRDWPARARRKLIATDPVMGLRGETAFKGLQNWLRR